MKNQIKTKLVVVYSQVGHYMYNEDTWEEEAVIETENDLYEFMVQCLKHDAHNHNNYPLNGHLLGSFEFYEEQYIKYDGKLFTSPDRKEVQTPDMFDSAKARINLLKTRAGRTLPKMRELKRERENHQKEYIRYKELQKKYGKAQGTLTQCSTKGQLLDSGEIVPAFRTSENGEPTNW